MDEKNINMQSDTSLGNFHPLLMLRDLFQHLWLIVAIAILAASLGYVGASVIYSPRYQASATFVVSTKTSSSTVFSNLNSATTMADSFSKVLASDVMRKYVAEDLGVDHIDADISANVVSETNILEITVIAGSQREAYLVTRSLINNYDRLTGKLLDNVTLEMLKGPAVPTSPINYANADGIAKKAFLAAAALVIVLVCVKSYLRDTVKTVEELEKKLDTKNLATIYHENKYKTLKTALKRNKTSILITNPTTGFAFVETYKKLRTKVDYSIHREGCRVIMVTSVLENEGKSTVSTNLALAMGRKYKNVLLVDADFKKPSLYKILGYQERTFASLPDILDGKASMSDAVIVDKTRKIMSIVSKNAVKNPEDYSNSSKFRKFIESSSEQLDVIIIDTPPMTAGPDAECIAELADAAILVVRQDQAPVRLINDSIDAINQSGTKLLGCVFNNVHSADLNDSVSYGYGGKHGYSGKYGYGHYGHRKNTESRENAEGSE